MEDAELTLLRSYLINTCKSQKTRQAKIRYIATLLSECKPFNRLGFEVFIAKKRTESRNGKVGNSAACINKYIQAIRSYAKFKRVYFNSYELYWTEELIQEKEDPHPKQILNQEEVREFLSLRRLLTQSDENYLKWQLFWSLAAYTGVRLGNLRTLTVEQVDFGNFRLIFPDTKTTATYSPLIDILLEPLAQRIKVIRGDYLFPSFSDRNKPMTDKAYQNEFKDRLQRLGIKRRIKAYAFRDTAIVKWLRVMKLNIFDVKRLANHKKSSTTERYFQLAELEELRKELNNDPTIDAIPAETIMQKAEKQLLESLGGACFDQEIVRQSLALLWKSIIKNGV